MEGYRIKDETKPHFVTFTVVDWIDIFSRSIYRDIFIDSLRFCQQKKGLIIYGFVVMTNHAHLILQSENGKLSDTIRDLKAFVARKILETVKLETESRADWMLKRFEWVAKTNGRNEGGLQLWRYGNHPEEIFSEKFFWNKLNYIHMNPVRAKIVHKASDYIYSSASNYTKNEGLIEIVLLSPPQIDVHKQDWMKNLDEW